MHKQIKLVTNTFKKKKITRLVDEDDIPVINPKKKEEIWRQYLNKLFDNTCRIKLVIDIWM